jgi:trans-aconitate methyltransferase
MCRGRTHWSTPEAFPDAEVVGVDISEQAIARTRNRVEAPEVDFVAADLVDTWGTHPTSSTRWVWSDTINYLGGRTTVPEMDA